MRLIGGIEINLTSAALLRPNVSTKTPPPQINNIYQLAFDRWLTSVLCVFEKSNA